jgi:hypothetical protein
MYLRRFFQFLNPVHSRYNYLDGGSARHMTSTYTQDNTNRINAHSQTFMIWVGFERTTPVFERAKTVQALDSAATVKVLRRAYGLELGERMQAQCDRTLQAATHFSEHELLMRFLATSRVPRATDAEIKHAASFIRIQCLAEMGSIHERVIWFRRRRFQQKVYNSRLLPLYQKQGGKGRLDCLSLVQYILTSYDP